MYIHHASSSVPKPEIELAGYARTHLQPGEAKTVSIPIEMRILSHPPCERLSESSPPSLQLLMGEIDDSTKLSHTTMSRVLAGLRKNELTSFG